MSYLICKSIKNNHDGTYTLQVAESNVTPRVFEAMTIGANFDSEGRAEELAIEKVVELAYYYELQFNSQGLRCTWGRRVHNAIESVTDGVPVWKKEGRTKEAEGEELKLCKRIVFSCVADMGAK